MSTRTAHNEAGHYRFLGSEGRPFSAGAVADAGFDIAHVTFVRPIRLEEGIAAAVRHLSSNGRPVESIAGIELRIPAPLSRDDFDAFNQRYVATLRQIGLAADDTIPAGRTNVAPTIGRLDEPSVFGFSYTVPIPRKPPAFILSGVPEEVSGSAGEMLSNIAGILASRAADLGCTLSSATNIQIYAATALDPASLAGVADAFGEAIIQGLHWFPSLPPIQGLNYEIDARSSGSDITI
jgi:hypothetical protein